MISSETSNSLTAVSPTVWKRFLFFTYSYWSETREGKGTLCLSSNNGFPRQKYVKEKAIEQVKNKYNLSESEISLIIENWIEMSEFDYNNWLS